MKLETRTIAVAFDGTAFDDPEECKAYEATRFEHRFVGLTIERVLAALDRDGDELELADAFERAGLLVRERRRKAGDFKRQPPGAMAKLSEREARASNLVFDGLTVAEASDLLGKADGVVE